MFLKIREANPELPILILTAPQYFVTKNMAKRTEVIRRTYQNAINRGDRNVWFLDGQTLMAYAKNEGTVDNCHPNDLGFASMAKQVGDLLEKILFGGKE